MKGHTSMIRTISVTALAAGTIAVTGVAFAGQDKIEFCHNDNNLHPIETSVQAFFNAGHIDHEGDIWPEFTYTENGPDGQEVTVPAQGDQAVLANGCKPIVIVESPSPSPSPSDIPSSPPVSVTPSPTPTQQSPSPTPSERETPEPPAPREEETREQVLDCDNLTYTITITYTVWPVYFDEAQWVWVEGEPEVHVGEPYVVDANPNECESSPTPSRTHTRSIPPTASSTTSPPASVTPAPSTVPVSELAHTGSDEWKIFGGAGLVLIVLGLIGWRIGRPTTPTHTPTHRL